MTGYAKGWDAYLAQIDALDWDDVVTRSGVDRSTIERVADLYPASKSAILSWAMGITHHEHGVENVQARAALAMVRRILGRPDAALLPLRGHSTVQGMGSVGVTPRLKDAVFERLESTLGVTLPTAKGLDTPPTVERANEGRMRFA